MSIGGGLLALVAVAGIIMLIAIWNNPAAHLAQVIKNTTSQKMLQLTVDTKPTQSKDSAKNIISLSNVKYKNGSGLTADATGQYANEYGDVTIKSNWVIASNSTVYVKHESSTVKPSDAAKKLMAEYKMPDGALNAMMNRDVGMWNKLGDSSTLVGVSYGFDPCILRVTYTMLGDQKGLDDFLKSLQSSHSLSVSSQGASYTVGIAPNSQNTANDAYRNSALYKTLAKCVSDDNSDTVQGGLGDLLTDAQLQFDVDTSNNTVKKIIYTPKDGITVTVTVGIIDNVTVTVPTVTPPQQLKPGETPEQYLQRTRPYVYKHLQDISDGKYY